MIPKAAGSGLRLMLTATSFAASILNIVIFISLTSLTMRAVKRKNCARFRYYDTYSLKIKLLLLLAPQIELIVGRGHRRKGWRRERELLVVVVEAREKCRAVRPRGAGAAVRYDGAHGRELTACHELIVVTGHPRPEIIAAIVPTLCNEDTVYFHKIRHNEWDENISFSDNRESVRTVVCRVVDVVVQICVGRCSA